MLSPPIPAVPRMPAAGTTTNYMRSEDVIKCIRYRKHKMQNEEAA
jgi:hypothetical protein